MYVSNREQNIAKEKMNNNYPFSSMCYAQGMLQAICVSDGGCARDTRRQILSVGSKISSRSDVHTQFYLKSAAAGKLNSK